ncbi:MAG: hypothetical protein IJF79_08845 [Clostridia bacterium]|nr:hypothetical protein [Clostridia bacterium]
MECVLEVARTKEGDYYFKVVGEDKQVLAQSGEFETLITCKRAIHALCQCVKAPVFEAEEGAFWSGGAVYEIYESEGRYTFLLKGDYGEVLAYGKIFGNMRTCRSAITAMVRMDLDHETEFEVF